LQEEPVVERAARENLPQGERPVAKLLEGKPVADQVLEDVAGRVTALRARGIVPGLATVLVGDDAASAGYVRKKHEACAAVGFYSENVQLPASTTQAELHATIQRLNGAAGVHGFLVQHPLPAPLDLGRALLEMDPQKDADGLHPENLGRLAIGLPGPVPATPAGVRALLLHYQIATAGRHVVVVGRGPTLGRPLSLLLSGKVKGADAAVTVVHSAVPDLTQHTRRADILVAGVGQPGIVQPDMVREGAVVISAGISWQGKRLLPDVTETVAEKAAWITPRIGGVGVTTVAMLLQNAVQLAESRAAR
jgi:methylenetetrahydrofolate dehydrogenase (NADP+)/methenyltetrahydrofolate cyclohydrolase